MSSYAHLLATVKTYFAWSPYCAFVRNCYMKVFTRVYPKVSELSR